MDCVRRLTTLLVGAVLVLGSCVAAQITNAPPASAAYGFSNDQIVAKAQSDPDGFHGGQCKVWAQDVVNAVLAANGIAARVRGYGSPGGAYYGAYENAGGTLVSAADARPGDLVQIIRATQKNSDYPSGRLHTAIIVGTTGTAGTVTVRDSNWNLNEKVSQHTFDPVAWARGGGSEAYFWRFGVAGQAGSTVPGEGSFVNYGGNVYRVAGGAPLYVSSWSVFGGPQPTTPLTAQQWSSLRAVPANGTDLVLQGVGTVYRIAGGAPLVVTTCTIGTTNFCADAVPVDPYAVSHLDHLNARPASGTDLAVAVSAGGTGSVYRVVGGAPLQVSRCTIGTTNFCAAAVPVDGYAVSHLDHLNGVPANGTDVALALESGGTGSVYRVAGGAPLIVSSCRIGTTDFCAYAVPIDRWALDRLDHLRAVPANGTDIALALSTGGTGSVYRIAGGAPFGVPTCVIAGVNFCAVAVAVDRFAFDRRDHLRSQPLTGTVVRAVSARSTWAFRGSCRSSIGNRPNAITVADRGLASFRVCPRPRPVVAPLTVRTKLLPSAHRGHRYRVSLSASGGTRSYTWRVVKGHLPKGLRMSSKGRITGKPRRKGSKRFTVRVRDGRGRIAVRGLSLRTRA